MAVARSTRDARIARRAAEVAIGARALDEAVQSAQLWRERCTSRTNDRSIFSVVSGRRVRYAYDE